jgi:hypothetical protein
MVPCVRLYVAPVSKLMRVATGRFDLVGADVDGAEVDVDIDGVALGSGVEADCVELAKGVRACNVPEITVEVASAAGRDTSEARQAALAKKSMVMAVFTIVSDLVCFIFLLFTTVIGKRQTRLSGYINRLAIQSRL